MGKRKLLYISARIPAWTGGGSAMRAASQIRVLSERFDVTLVMVGDLGSEVEVHKRLAVDLRKACVSVLVISRIPLINRLLRRTRRSWARVLFEALWPTPALFVISRPALAELGKRLAGKGFDVVHCFRLNTSLPRSIGRHGIMIGRSVLDFDDYESQAEFRSSKTFRSLVGKKVSALMWLTGVKWWVLESLLIPSFNDALVCSEFDRQRLRRRFPGVHWHVVPNTVAEPPEFNPVGGDVFAFLFVGTFDYLPNFDAALFFCTRVLPLLRKNAPRGFRVLIVGRAGYDLTRLAGIEEVRVIVNPSEIAPYYAQSDAVIVPVRGGGGTRTKILEAFSYGLPVVSTTIGAEGLDVTPGSDIIIADGAEDFAEQCHRIWTDDFLRRRIAAAGRELWRRNYSPAALVAALNDVYEGNEIRDVGRRLDTAL
jgi:glycosyltransferase involved in cell wall biosynthesis